MSALLTMQQLHGVLDTHVAAVPPLWSSGEAKLHAAAIDAFSLLRRDAGNAGFDLRIASGFRDFQRQTAIWNAKARGQRPVLDDNEQSVDILSLPERERVFAMLRWSALPGTSRHHWGTDVDVFDQAAIAADYKLRLSVAETSGNGPFGRLHCWLDEQIAANRAHGFFRPYTGSGCGIAAEPWHLSYAPLAVECQRRFNAEALSSLWQSAGMELQETVEAQRAEILRRFFWVPAWLYPEQWRAGIAEVPAPDPPVAEDWFKP